MAFGSTSDLIRIPHWDVIALSGPASIIRELMKKGLARLDYFEEYYWDDEEHRINYSKKNDLG